MPPKPSFLISISLSDEAPTEDCAMWWATSEDKNPETSETIRLLTTIYTESDGFESFILAQLFSHLGYLDPKLVQRITYPEETIYQTLRHRSGIHLVVSADQEHGIRFRFPIKSCSVAQRERILTDYLEFVRTVRLNYADTNRDPEWDPNGLQWWTQSLKATKKMQAKGEQIQKIGYIPRPEEQ